MDIELLLVRLGLGGTVFVHGALLAALSAAVRLVGSARNAQGQASAFQCGTEFAQVHPPDEGPLP